MLAKLRTVVAALLLGAFVAGCVIRPPVLLEPENPKEVAKRRARDRVREEKKRRREGGAPVTVTADAGALPFKCGLRSVTFPGSTLSTCSTYMVPFVFVRARFPNIRDESLYVRDSVLTYYRDAQLFQYVYDDPFDPADVNLVMDVRFEKFRFSNGAYGTSRNWALFILNFAPMFMSASGPEGAFAGSIVSLVSLILQIASPQEIYSWGYAMEVKLSDPSGKELKTYKAGGSGSDAVWIFGQPYAKYLWYRGEFKEDFYDMLESVRGQIEKDPPS